MPNWEKDDNSTDEGTFGGGPTRQLIDQCAGCHHEIDTTGDPSPTCPLCGSGTWFRYRTLDERCPYRHPGCRGQRASVTEHVCSLCLDCLAIHDRVARAGLRCMCAMCNPSMTLVDDYDAKAKPRSRTSRVKRENPFDTDDWLCPPLFLAKYVGRKRETPRCPPSDATIKYTRCTYST
jgi:hypothetical protein